MNKRTTAIFVMGVAGALQPLQFPFIFRGKGALIDRQSLSWYKRGLADGNAPDTAFVKLKIAYAILLYEEVCNGNFSSVHQDNQS